MPGEGSPNPPPGPDDRSAGDSQGSSSSGPIPGTDASLTCPVAGAGPSSAASGTGASLTCPVAGASANPNSGPARVGNSDSQSGSWQRGKRRSKAQDSAAEHQRIVLALWPTPVIKKDLRDAAGQDPDPVRLLSSARFRDAWSSFSKESQPSSRMLVDLRKLVVEIMSAKGGRARKAQNPPPSKSVEKVVTSKRKNRSLSLERSTSPKAAVQPKIPRIGHTPPSGHNPSTSTPKPSLEEVEEEDENLVANEASEPTLEEFAADVRDALPDFSKVVAGKADKPDFPYILYVHSGKEERRTMSRETWTVLLEKLQVATLNLVLNSNGEEGAKVEWTGYARGVGLVAPADEASRDTVKNLISGLQVADESFRAWAKGEKGEWTPLSLRIPATMAKKTFTAGKIMTAACLLNKLPGKDSFQIRDCQDVKNSKDRLLRITAKKDLVDALIQRDGVIYVASSKLRVYFQRSPLTKDSKL